MMRLARVSVLFSEPKIPQRQRTRFRGGSESGFSALQRAENSSTQRALAPTRGDLAFQCSSASRKFLNAPRCRHCSLFVGFSALQRAENSSTVRRDKRWCGRTQSFSALQRAENSSTQSVAEENSSIRRFSALQRAENSSTRQPQRRSRIETGFQCSSASRKFLNRRRRARARHAAAVSVLFSEPKIPQPRNWGNLRRGKRSFSALQRAENSSTGHGSRSEARSRCFSALQRAENSSTVGRSGSFAVPRCVSVLFSEPKIPQLFEPDAAIRARVEFQCSSASRKFLKQDRRLARRDLGVFQCSSASRKFLNYAVSVVSVHSTVVSVLFSEPKIPQ